MYTAKQREYYNQYRNQVCQKLGITINQFNAFRRLGNNLHKWYEENCNGTVEDAFYEDSTNVLYNKANKKAKELNLEIYFQTDPRGATIYLDNKPIPENSYNNAFCIY